MCNIFETANNDSTIIENHVQKYANTLERCLANYLKCNYNDFGIKANDYLLCEDWKSPINFVLGYIYAKSNNNSEKKEEIEYFRGDILKGKNIYDLLKNYEYYCFESKDKVFEYLQKVIDELEKIMDNSDKF